MKLQKDWINRIGEFIKHVWIQCDTKVLFMLFPYLKIE